MNKPKTFTQVKNELMNRQSNPFITSDQLRVKTRQRAVRTTVTEELINPVTHERKAVATITTIEHRDDAQFVKVFASGIAAMFDLGKAAQKAFNIVLHHYEQAPMNLGYSEFVELDYNHDSNTVNGTEIEISRATWTRGMTELMLKGFVAPRSNYTYWINPALFFKGDRFRFVKEYRRTGLQHAGQHELTFDDEQP